MHDMCIESEFEFLRLRVEVIDNLWDFSHHWDFSLEFKIERILLWKERTDHIDGFWKEEDFFFFFWEEICNCHILREDHDMRILKTHGFGKLEKVWNLLGLPQPLRG